MSDSPRDLTILIGSPVPRRHPGVRRLVAILLSYSLYTRSEWLSTHSFTWLFSEARARECPRKIISDPRARREDPAYLFAPPTFCDHPGGTGPGLCRIVDMTFRERASHGKFRVCAFHALW